MSALNHPTCGPALHKRPLIEAPDDVTEFSIAMSPAGHQLAPGCRLRLSLCSAYFPECDPNTNTGNPALTDTEVRVAKQTVFHDRAKPLHIILPVIDARVEGS